MNILDYMLNDMIDTLSNESVFTEKATTEQYRIYDDRNTQVRPIKRSYEISTK